MNKHISQAPFDLLRMNALNGKGIDRLMGIKLTAIGPDFVCGEMPVDNRTHQPFGLLHGGASIVLAETLGSWASYMLVVDNPRSRVAGIEVSGSHVRAVKSGKVIATARPLRLTRGLHFWTIDVRDEWGHLCCAAKLTVKVSSGGEQSA